MAISERTAAARVPHRLTIGGVAVDVCSRNAVLGLLRAHLAGGRVPLVVASANLDHVHHFGPRGRHAGVLERAERDARWLVLLDGMPLVWRAGRHVDGPVERLTGADLLGDFLLAAREEDRSVGVLGGTTAMHEALRRVVTDLVPGLDLRATWAPEREDLHDPRRSERLALAVRDAGVDLLVVALGKPLQELWTARHGKATGAKVLALFGAAPDFLAGRVDRAPRWMQDCGLEWAYRLGREPRRMARRYLVQGPPALGAVVLG